MAGIDRGQDTVFPRLVVKRNGFQHSHFWSLPVNGSVATGRLAQRWHESAGAKVCRDPAEEQVYAERM
jgi:hypothetical protein